MASLDIDGIIYNLTKKGECRTTAKLDLEERDILLLIRKVKEKLIEQPVVLDLSAPITVCGDIHGQFYDLLTLFGHTGFPPTTNYLFLGDYVDRGTHSLECIILLFCFKVKFPTNFFLLRGNHECMAINHIYGFYKECRRRYSVKLWREFCEAFNCLPLAAVIEEKIFCTHGGLSPELSGVRAIDKIRTIVRPVDVPDNGLLCDLLWSDPDPSPGWRPNDRGVSYTFGPPQVEAFLTANGFDLVTRAHQVVMAGYEFFSHRRLVTLFSAPNYCGEYGNNGAVMSIDSTLMCSFQIIQARYNDRTNTPSSALWENGSKPGTPPREYTRRGLY